MTGVANTCWISLQVNGMSPDGGGRQLRWVTAATTQKAWASMASVTHQYPERQGRS